MSCGTSNRVAIAAKFTPPPVYEALNMAPMKWSCGMTVFSKKNATMVPATVPTVLIKKIINNRLLSCQTLTIFDWNKSKGMASGTT